MYVCNILLTYRPVCRVGRLLLHY